MPVPFQASYDFQNVVRSVMAEYEALKSKMPTLIQLVRTGAPARSTKEEWPELQLAPASTTIASFGTDGDGVSITVADASSFKVGDILYFESSAGADRQELVRITAISTNTLTVTRDYASSPGATLAVNDVVYLQSRPKGEGSTAEGDNGKEAGLAFNYTQITRRTAKVTRTNIQTSHYGVGDLVNQQVAFQLVDILREQSNALIRGYKAQRSGSLEGTSGGILQFLAGGNIETTGSALTKTHINNALRMIYDDGGYSNAYAILCAPNQAQRISGFNTSGTNPVVMVDPSGTSTGSFVSKFVGDLPVQTGFMANIVVEPNFPKDKVAILDMNNIEVAYLQALQDADATPAGYDGVLRDILGEYTFRIMNGQTAHALITGLTI